MVSMISSNDTIAFKLKNNFYNFISFDLITSNQHKLYQQLAAMIDKSPKFFQNTSIILNLDTLPSSEPLIDLRAIKSVLSQFAIRVVAVCGSEQYGSLATLAEMTWLPSQKTKQIKNNEEKSKSVVLNEMFGSKSQENDQSLITQPVRSGQQACSQSDLVVLSRVSEGAELLAHGHIHIYGACKGKILAGIGGDKNARIFCHKFEAELISIAGRYKVINTEDSCYQFFGKSVQIFLENNQLKILSF